MPALATLRSDSRKELVADANVTVNQFPHSKLGDDYDIHASIRDKIRYHQFKCALIIDRNRMAAARQALVQPERVVRLVTHTRSSVYQ
jgi:hypothetical protein